MDGHWTPMAMTMAMTMTQLLKTKNGILSILILPDAFVWVCVTIDYTS